jgi:RNA polymerase sigma-70 factor (ECF subfamily)
VGRWGAAEDLAQEALLRGYAALKTLSDPERFGAWLHGIATRACLDWLKSKQRTQVNFSDLAPGGGAEEWFQGRGDEALDVERDDEIERLLGEVEALPEEYRKVLLLYYYDDVTYGDIAGMLGVSAATVNARLTKARALLRRRLSGARR